MLCEAATWVAAHDPTSAASSLEFAPPNATHPATPPSAHLSYAGLHHEVQQIANLNPNPYYPTPLTLSRCNISRSGKTSPYP